VKFWEILERIIGKISSIIDSGLDFTYNDGIVAVKAQVKARLENKQVEQDLTQATFGVNLEKNVWDSLQKQEWFGFNIDSAAGDDHESKNWKAKIKPCIGHVHKDPPIKQLASLVRKFISMSLQLPDWWPVYVAFMLS